MRGKSPAVITANTVMPRPGGTPTGAKGARNRKRIAEISVPECAIPTQKTKVVMSTPNRRGVEAHTPSPRYSW